MGSSIFFIGRSTRGAFIFIRTFMSSYCIASTLKSFSNFWRKGGFIILESYPIQMQVTINPVQRSEIFFFTNTFAD